MKFKSLKVGEKYTLDKNYRNSSDVVLIRKGQLFGTVQDNRGIEWDVMLYRLSLRKNLK